MGDEIDHLLALYNEYENILRTLYFAGILEEEEWDVVKIFLEDSEALENIRAVQVYGDLENGALEKSETPPQSANQGAKRKEKSKASESNSRSASTSETPREPTSDLEFVAERVNGWQWFMYPKGSDKK